MPSAHMVVDGRVRVRTYDHIGVEQNAIVVRPTQDVLAEPGHAAAMTTPSAGPWARALDGGQRAWAAAIGMGAWRVSTALPTSAASRGALVRSDDALGGQP
jgi:hypothetical protein